jgi:SAM-dependent methyltransferase
MADETAGGELLAAACARAPVSARVVLEQRGLRTGNPGLRGLVRPGMRILDVGCGTGSISRAIARAVGRTGHVVAVDQDEVLINRARRLFGHVANLEFAVYGALRELPGGFDLACCARLLQWLAKPELAVDALASAVVPGGLVQILDCDHLQAEWDPDLPPAMRHFYEAFLTWRSDSGMDNRVGRRLPELLRTAGLIDVSTRPMAHTCRRDRGADWEHASLWADVVATRGDQLVRAGYVSDSERRAAESQYQAWLTDQGAVHVLALVSAYGRRPPADG